GSSRFRTTARYRDAVVDFAHAGTGIDQILHVVLHPAIRQLAAQDDVAVAALDVEVAGVDQVVVGQSLANLFGHPRIGALIVAWALATVRPVVVRKVAKATRAECIRPRVARRGFAIPALAARAVADAATDLRKVVVMKGPRAIRAIVSGPARRAIPVAVAAGSELGVVRRLPVIRLAGVERLLARQSAPRPVLVVVHRQCSLRVPVETAGTHPGETCRPASRWRQGSCRQLKPGARCLERIFHAPIPDCSEKSTSVQKACAG